MAKDRKGSWKWGKC